MIEAYLMSRYRAGARGETDNGIRYFDCWGLVRAVRHEVYGLALMDPHEGILPTHKRAMTRIARQTLPSLVVGDAQDGSIVLVWERGLCDHVGVCVALDGHLGVLDTTPQFGPTWKAFGRYARIYGDIRCAS